MKSAQIPSDSSGLARARARSAFAWLWLGNIALGVAIGLAYLDGLALGPSLRLWLFAHLGLVSTVATMSLVPAALVWLCARARFGTRVHVIVQSVLWMLFQIALIIDTRVWGLFRYHFNSAAWNLITTEGSEDSYRLGAKIWIVGFALGGVLFAAQWIAWKRLIAIERRAAALRVASLIGAAAVVLSVCVEKSIYAQAELTQDRRVAEVSDVFPLYARLDVTALLPEPLIEARERLPEEPVAYEGARLVYPLHAPTLAPNGPRPNILVLVVDSWRRDMLREDVTPNLARFAADARRFDDHLSSGNGTRFGVFGLLYGLHGSYWWPMLEARRGPVLLSALAELGYEQAVFSSASMSYPEFRSTAWVELAEHVRDEFGDRRQSERDQAAVDACLDWWRTRDASRPSFTFVLLDAAHQRYDFTAEDELFTPYATDFDYLEMAGSHDAALVESVRNRYMNALHGVDRAAARLLDELRRSGALEHTLVVVTGDHGEEFAENGYWGHTGNFTREQVAVPFLLRGPGVGRGVETRPTSHVDLAGTLLGLLGADPAERGAWCLSEDLLAPPAQRARVVAGWEEVGLWTDSGIFRIPRERKARAGAAVCDATWQILEDQHTAFRNEAPALARLVEESARFLLLPVPGEARAVVR